MVSFSSLFRSNAQRSGRNLLITVLLVTASLGLLAGCSDGAPSTFPVGTWGTSNDAYEITTTSISYSGSFNPFSANVVKISEGYVNGGDSDPFQNKTSEEVVDYGYAVVEYTSPTSLEGTYNVFRWGTDASDSTVLYFTQWLDEDNSFALGSFDSVDAAEAGATNSSGSTFAGTYSKE